MGRKLGVRRRTASSATPQGRMILLSPDAVEDVERLRTFLDQTRHARLAWTRSADLIVAAEDPVSTSFENATNPAWPGLGGRRAGWCAQSLAAPRAGRNSGRDGSPRREPRRLPGLALIDRGAAAD